ncbi:hypothetical protein ACPPVS_10390 [Cellulomonas sp. McL0617]|uniref:hypothetical protein n=1 Tax=Cellulomonas sp. McL0617 TaxID=3415675 RepID=UPI003CF9078A
MSTQQNLGDQTTAVLDQLVGAGVRFGRSMIDALTSSTPVSDAVGAATDAAGKATAGLKLGSISLPQVSMGAPSCGCAIPDACFLPEKLPTVTAHGCPGATMKLRILVTNEWPASRVVAIRATGADAKAVTIDPVQQAVGPYEAGTFTATVHLADEGADGVSVLLWVRGCRDHVVRWEVSSSDGGCACVHEVAVLDKPDTVHHWYDHFYKEPCCRPQPRVRVPTDHG